MTLNLETIVKKLEFKKKIMAPRTSVKFTQSLLLNYRPQPKWYFIRFQSKSGMFEMVHIRSFEHSCMQDWKEQVVYKEVASAL